MTERTVVRERFVHCPSSSGEVLSVNRLPDLGSIVGEPVDLPRPVGVRAESFDELRNRLHTHAPVNTIRTLPSTIRTRLRDLTA